MLAQCRTHGSRILGALAIPPYLSLTSHRSCYFPASPTYRQPSLSVSSFGNPRKSRGTGSAISQFPIGKCIFPSGQKFKRTESGRTHGNARLMCYYGQLIMSEEESLDERRIPYFYATILVHICTYVRTSTGTRDALLLDYIFNPPSLPPAPPPTLQQTTLQPSVSDVVRSYDPAAHPPLSYSEWNYYAGDFICYICTLQTSAFSLRLIELWPRVYAF